MFQVIFQIRIDGKWLDYCREPSPHKEHLNPTNNWAKDQCTSLEKREGKPFRFILEFWR